MAGIHSSGDLSTITAAWEQESAHSAFTTAGSCRSCRRGGVRNPAVILGGGVEPFAPADSTAWKRDQNEREQLKELIIVLSGSSLSLNNLPNACVTYIYVF